MTKMGGSARSALVLAVLAAVVVCEPLSDAVTAALEPSVLVQSELGEPSLPPDYVGCGLGYFWCARLREANVSAADAAKLSWPPTPNLDEWWYDGKPTCVARGMDRQPCEASGVMLCAGGDSFGSAEEQTAAVKLALEQPSRVHPECPGCVQRSVDHSPTVCYLTRGGQCDFVCDSGFGKQTDTLTCDDNGKLVGGCKRVYASTDEVNEVPVPDYLMDTSLSPSPSPSAVHVYTPNDIDHANETAYLDRLEFKRRQVYRDMLKTEACQYLLDLDDFLRSQGVRPLAKIRAPAVETAKLADCAWAHDAVIADGEEPKKQFVPKRGDHGPWPDHSKQVIHVKVGRREEVAVAVAPDAKGEELYAKTAAVLGVSKASFTLYAPKTSEPIDVDQPLSRYHITRASVVPGDNRAIQLPATANTEQPRNAWRDKGLANDPHMGPIGP